MSCARVRPGPRCSARTVDDIDPRSVSPVATRRRISRDATGQAAPRTRPSATPSANGDAGRSCRLQPSVCSEQRTACTSTSAYDMGRGSVPARGASGASMRLASSAGGLHDVEIELGHPIPAPVVSSLTWRTRSSSRSRSPSCRSRSASVPPWRLARNVVMPASR